MSDHIPDATKMMTPRTEIYVLNPLPEVVPAEFARELERELATVTAERDRLRREHRAMSKGAQTNSASLFAPFDADGILCVQDGKIVANPDDERGWTEYHIEHMHGDVWRIERCDAAELCSFVYQGQIPDRDFFVALMRNQETPLPEAALRGDVPETNFGEI